MSAPPREAVSIPFNRPYVAPGAIEHITRALDERHLRGDGEMTKECEAILCALHNGASALLTTSCTHALELAALLLDLGRGDEVLVPSYTFASTANAFALRGARVVFVDVRPDTINIDERLIEAKITHQTRAICLIHYGGVAANMSEIMRIASGHGLAVVEDNAHGLFGAYRGQALGTFGQLSTLSFHETKNISCGEGGAIIVNKAELLDRAEIVREKGTNRRQFYRGSVDKYTWVDIGSSYLPSEILAAFLLSQLEQRDEIQHRRRKIFERYARELIHWTTENGVQLPTIPNDCTPAYHLFYLLFPDLAARTRAIDALRRQGVQAVFHYVPLHSSPMGLRQGALPDDCPVSTAVGERLLRLPFYNDMTDDEQTRVIRSLLELR